MVLGFWCWFCVKSRLFQGFLDQRRKMRETQMKSYWEREMQLKVFLHLLFLFIFQSMMHGYFKTGDILCLIISETTLSMCKIRIYVMSMGCPCRIQAVYVHHRFQSSIETPFLRKEVDGKCEMALDICIMGPILSFVVNSEWSEQNKSIIGFHLLNKNKCNKFNWSLWSSLKHMISHDFKVFGYQMQSHWWIYRSTLFVCIDMNS